MAFLAAVETPFPAAVETAFLAAVELWRHFRPSGSSAELNGLFCAAVTALAVAGAEIIALITRLLAAITTPSARL